jgi:hypothetical protein
MLDILEVARLAIEVIAMFQHLAQQPCTFQSIVGAALEELEKTPIARNQSP